MGCSLPGSSVHGIFQAIVLEWIAISFSKEIWWIGAGFCWILFRHLLISCDFYSNLLIWWITLTDFWKLNQRCIIDINPSSSCGVYSFHTLLDLKLLLALKLHGPVLLTFHWPSKSHDHTELYKWEKCEYILSALMSTISVTSTCSLPYWSY